MLHFWKLCISGEDAPVKLKRGESGLFWPLCKHCCRSCCCFVIHIISAGYCTSGLFRHEQPKSLLRCIYLVISVYACVIYVHIKQASHTARIFLPSQRNEKSQRYNNSPPCVTANRFSLLTSLGCHQQCYIPLWNNIWWEIAKKIFSPFAFLKAGTSAKSLAHLP